MEIEQLCIKCDFNEMMVDEKLKGLDTAEKYKGLTAFEWQLSKSKAEKAIDRK